MNREEVLNELYARIEERGTVTEDDGVIIHDTGLTEFEIPDGVTEIGKNAFNDCEKLTSVIIPDSVEIIDEMAFGSCKNLTSVTIPDSVIFIGEYAFGGCKSLTSITIPKSVKEIGYKAFAGCSRLGEIIFQGRTLEEIKDMENYPRWKYNAEEIIVADDSSRNASSPLGESLINKWRKLYLKSI
jgi:hypothetical protein